MSIRLDKGGVYTTQNDSRVMVLSEVSNGYIGTMRRMPDGTMEFTPHSYFRCVLLGTGEVVFYNRYGNLISEKPSASDKPYQIVRVA